MMKTADQQVLPFPLLPVIWNPWRNPLAPKHPPSLGFSSAELARVVMHQGSNVAESKSSHFLDHILRLVHHTASQKQVLTCFRGRWSWRGKGCWSCSSTEEISARLCMRISTHCMVRPKNDFTLVIAIGVSLSQITAPVWFFSWSHKCYPNYFF